jgi:hypothetical protein
MVNERDTLSLLNAKCTGTACTVFHRKSNKHKRETFDAIIRNRREKVQSAAARTRAANPLIPDIGSEPKLGPMACIVSSLEG